MRPIPTSSGTKSPEAEKWLDRSAKANAAGAILALAAVNPPAAVVVAVATVIAHGVIKSSCNGDKK